MERRLRPSRTRQRRPGEGPGQRRLLRRSARPPRSPRMAEDGGCSRGGPRRSRRRPGGRHDFRQSAPSAAVAPGDRPRSPLDPPSGHREGHIGAAAPAFIALERRPSPQVGGDRATHMGGVAPQSGMFADICTAASASALARALGSRTFALLQRHLVLLGLAGRSASSARVSPLAELALERRARVSMRLGVVRRARVDRGAASSLRGVDLRCNAMTRSSIDASSRATFSA